MDKRYFFYLIVSTLLLVDCATHKKIEYNIPVDIKGDKKDELLASLEKGRKLYEASCSKCHGIFTKGKDGIPNFTDQQFDNYSAYSIKHDPKNHAVAANISPEQLHEIVMFLKARKRKGSPTQQIQKNPAFADSLGK